MRPTWPLRRTIWTVSQIAREMGCAARTVRLWCERGQLPATRRGALGHFRVTAEALLTFCEADLDTADFDDVRVDAPAFAAFAA